MSYILEIRVAVPLDTFRRVMSQDMHPSDKTEQLTNLIGDYLGSFPEESDKGFDHFMDFIGEGELDRERTDDITLEEGIEFLGGQGFTILTANKPEDIDKWPPASEVFGGDDELE